MFRPLVIVHGKCFDGFTAAWVMWQYMFGNDADYHFALYGEPPPEVDGRNVYMFDFSYKRDVMIDLMSRAKTFQCFDHHKTAEKNLVDLPTSETHRVLFDMTKCGARLAWEFACPDVKVPSLVDYVEDRDLWKWELPYTQEKNAVIASYEMTFENWEFLHSRFLAIDSCTIVEEGSALLRAKKQFIRLMCENAREATLPEQFGKFAGESCLIVNAPYYAISEVCHELANKYGFAVGYFQRKDGKWQYSFRSTPESGIDVSAIAEVIGGGGHRNASGAESNSLLFS